MSNYQNSLHGADTRLRMNKFQIGRIEGDWLNFRPPIHGGVFRPYVEDENEDSCLEEQQGSAEGHYRSASPASSDCSDDRGFLLDPSIRRRKGGSYDGSLASSISSLSEDEKNDDKNQLATQAAKDLEFDLTKYPSLDQETQKHIVMKYRRLDQRIRKEGLYQCCYSSYMIELARYLTFLFTSLYLLHLGWYKLSALFLGIFWHQITFTAHDSGHMGITHNFTTDTCIGIFIADFCGGLSLGWWKLSHNVGTNRLGET